LQNFNKKYTIVFYGDHPHIFLISDRQHSLTIVRIVAYSRGGACPTERGSTPFGEPRLSTELVQ